MPLNGYKATERNAKYKINWYCKKWKKSKGKIKMNKIIDFSYSKKLRNFFLNTFNIFPGNYDHNWLYKGVKCPSTNFRGDHVTKVFYGGCYKRLKICFFALLFCMHYTNSCNGGLHNDYEDTTRSLLCHPFQFFCTI